MTQRIPVAVLGATGSVGQRFISLLQHHPWFEIAALAASDRSAGKRYADATKWLQSTPLSPAVASMPVQPSAPPLDCPLVLSALDASVAGPVETAFARSGAVVVSNAKSHRYDADAPLLVPEVNADHAAICATQTYGDGVILTNPNCSTIGLVMALKPLADAFGVTHVHVTTLQAVSGAGLPGVSSFEILDNVIPFIGDEEEKMERETRKILGRFDGSRIVDADITISAQCNRVPVLDGHTECVSVKLGRRGSIADVRAAWDGFTAAPQALKLPSAPSRPVVFHERPDAPQPRLHRDLERGMATSVGRLRPCSIQDYKFVVLSHNTVRGAAGGALLVAELAVARGLVRHDLADAIRRELPAGVLEPAAPAGPR